MVSCVQGEDVGLIVLTDPGQRAVRERFRVLVVGRQPWRPNRHRQIDGLAQLVGCGVPPADVGPPDPDDRVLTVEEGSLEHVARPQEPEVHVSRDESLLQGAPCLGAGLTLSASAASRSAAGVGLGQGRRQSSQPAGLHGEFSCPGHIAFSRRVLRGGLRMALLAPRKGAGHRAR